MRIAARRVASSARVLWEVERLSFRLVEAERYCRWRGVCGGWRRRAFIVVVGEV